MCVLHKNSPVCNANSVEKNSFVNFYKIFRVFSLNGTGHFLSRAVQDFFLHKRHTVFFFAHGTPRFPRMRNTVLFFFVQRNKFSSWTHTTLASSDNTPALFPELHTTFLYSGTTKKQAPPELAAKPNQKFNG